MKIYLPDDILDFGKNKGLKLSFVFKYQPSYIEWAIENITDFKIDIKAFEALPKPTPGNYNKNSFSEDKKYPLAEDQMLEDVIELIIRSDTVNQSKSINAKTWKDKESNQSLKSIDYRFPDRIILLNNNK